MIEQQSAGSIILPDKKKDCFIRNDFIKQQTWQSFQIKTKIDLTTGLRLSLKDFLLYKTDLA
ncbi:MAG: hypothetical protein DI535_03975 [Citrobacter freundii]|nr:MAG: hypothetical protein DI535_03975 [Citrobacter freundii]